MDNEITREILIPYPGRLISREIAKYFRERIKNGSFPPGSLLPSLRTISKQLDVDMHCVREAMHLLRNERLICSRQGKGTFVSSEPKWKRIGILLLNAGFTHCKKTHKKVIHLFSLNVKQTRNSRKR